MAKMRLDILLVERGLAESRSLAQRLVMAGQVLVEGQVVLKPATKISEEAKVEIKLRPPFVSRGGEKLAKALQVFQIDVKGKVCADVGASTGGFTDCLLQYGAERVYTIDVGKGILHWKLRSDPRVVVMEETNARYLNCLPEAVSLVTVDVSFISLKILLPVIRKWFFPDTKQTDHENRAVSEGGQVIALIKPQFEASRREVSRGEGVIRQDALRQQIVNGVLKFAEGQGYHVCGLIPSPLLGPKGNVEFLAWLTIQPDESVKG